MRRPVDEIRVKELIRTLGARARGDVRVYMTGGSSAVLEGWRATTKDVDLKLVPDDEGILRAIPETKEKLEINVELASPDDFIPPLPGWEQRSRFISTEGKATFFHYDFYAQALAKLERGHDVDLTDVQEMANRGLIDAAKLEGFFEAIEPDLYRYPAVDPRSFRRRVKEFLDRTRTA